MYCCSFWILLQTSKDDELKVKVEKDVEVSKKVSIDLDPNSPKMVQMAIFMVLLDIMSMGL